MQVRFQIQVWNVFCLNELCITGLDGERIIFWVPSMALSMAEPSTEYLAGSKFSSRLLRLIESGV